MNVTEILTAPRTCCICLDPLTDWPIGAHNADPVADGHCCTFCNEHIVTPAREVTR